jgi:hypothetical protein
MALGWGTAEPAPDFEEKFRLSAVFPPVSARNTVRDLKREMVDEGLTKDREAFVAKHPRAASPNSLAALKRGR